MTVRNVTEHLSLRAEDSPERLALCLAHGHGFKEFTYSELERHVREAVAGLQEIGVKRGDRVVLMVPPSLEFFALTFAMLRLGAVLVMVDPGMGVKNLGECLDEAEPDVFIGVPKAHLARVLFGWGRRTLRKRISVGWFPGVQRFVFGNSKGTASATETPGLEETAAVLFTSGSTGVPKGVVYRHSVFVHQVDLMQKAFGFGEGERDLSTFPLFALFSPALGITSVVPKMDASRPAKAKESDLARAIERYQIDNLFLNPALLDKLGRYFSAGDPRLRSVKRVISAGAPIAAQVMERFQQALPAQVPIYSGYGSTEALPVATASSLDLAKGFLQDTAAGKGVCVGVPVDGVQVKIIPIDDAPVTELEPVGPGEIGEICVKGPMVTDAYYNRPKQTLASKVESEGLWHRMGDLGYFDEKGRLWMCGRKAHRVASDSGEKYTVCCEAIALQHRSVRRAALVAGVAEPVMILEAEPGLRRRDKGRAIEEVQRLLLGSEVTAGVKKAVWYPGGLPVDVRHNAKIRRESLAQWAQSRGI